jgi:lysophospholipase L1-like esterase
MAACVVLAMSGCGESPTAPSSVTSPPPVTAPPPTSSQPSVPPSPTLKITKILCFGDSMTAGTLLLSPSAGPGVAESYPARLLSLLSQRYPSQKFTVENEGKPREWADDGQYRLVPLLQSLKPEVVILMEGVNDINALGSGGVTLALAALENMLRDARARGAQVLIATLPPQRPNGASITAAAFAKEYSAQVRRLADRQRVLLLDVELVFGGNLSLIGADGLHPTADGYLRIAQAALDVLRVNFEQPVTAQVTP